MSRQLVPVRPALLGLLLWLLAGCTSIPLGTLWKLRNSGVEALATLDPEQLRVASRIEPAPLHLDPARSKLILTLMPRGGAVPVRHTFGLRPAKVYSGLLVPAGDRR